MGWWKATKKFVGGVWGDPTATEAERGRGIGPVCPSGYVLTTDGEICIDDLILDVPTGDLITPAEVRRREEAEQKAREHLAWDEIGEEWIQPRELRARNRERATAARRAAGEEVYDRETQEWVTPEERKRRVAQRAVLRDAMKLGPLGERAALPSLSLAKAAGITIGADGIAMLQGKPAAEVLAEEEVVGEEEAGWKQYLKELTGPDRRDEEEAMRTRLLIIASLGAIIATLVLTRSRG